MNRKGTAFLIVFVGMCLYVAFSRDVKVGSTYSFTPDGARAFLVLLQEEGFEPELWLHPYDKLKEQASEFEGDYTMFLVSPESMGAEKELIDWVKRGNQLVFLNSSERSQKGLLAPLGLGISQKEFHFVDSFDVSKHKVKNVSCDEEAWPFCAGVTQLTPFEVSFELLDDDWEVVLGDKNEALVVQRKFGKGIVYAIANDKLILNRTIDKFDNFRFLFQLLSASNPILLVDEFHHGYTAPVKENLKEEKQSLVLFAVCLLFLLVIFALNRSVRFGNPNETRELVASGTSEFASVLGLLYREHKADSVLRNYLRAWRGRVEKEYGVSSRLSLDQYKSQLIREGYIRSVEEESLGLAFGLLAQEGRFDSTKAERAVYALEGLYRRMNEEGKHD